MSEESNLWLKGLTNRLESDRTAERLLRAYEKHQKEELYQSVMDVVIHANEERFMVSDMCEALEEILDKRAEIKAIKLAEEKAVKLAEEKAVKLAEEKIAEREKSAEARGIKQGLTQGEQQKMLTLIRKKIRKGKSIAQIADELEETEETILPLYNQLKEEEAKLNQTVCFASCPGNPSQT